MAKKDLNKVNLYKREILRLFLTIHMNHIKKSLKIKELPHNESNYSLAQKQGSYENWELNITIGEHTYNRIMSIRLLAEGSGAKSIVFEVIFDIHIVIKIPPSKITDFSLYLRKVMHEKSVVNCLEDEMVTIVPEFQCILKKIYPLEGKVGFENNQKMEDRYIELLKKEKRIHRFLQLDGGYVFFMYLSRNKTLGDFIRLVFNETEMVEKEIRENEGIFWDSNSFQGRYEIQDQEDDSELDGLFLKYNEAFEFIDSYLKSAIRNEFKINIETYHTRQWFLEYLSHQKLDIDEASFPAGFVQTLTIAFKYIIHNYSDTFEQFFKLIKAYAEKKRYTYNKERLRIVFSNFMVMLGILFRKGIAHRDLKPDNIIIVAGNFERSQMVQSEIGLIDFETAYAIQLKDNIEVAGGTSHYSAISQLFYSTVLENVYDENFKELYLYQDMYASVGVIFQLLTGHTLFMKTGVIFKNVFAQLLNNPTPRSKCAYIKLSKEFWGTAISEFNEKIRGHEKILDSFQVRLTADQMSDFLDTFFKLDYLESELTVLDGLQKFLFKNQNVFNDAQINILKESDSKKIIGLIVKNEKKGLHTHIQILNKLLMIKDKTAILKNIQRLKRDIANYRKMRSAIEKEHFYADDLEIMKIQLSKQKESIEERPGLNATGLLRIFFDMTLNKMHLKDW